MSGVRQGLQLSGQPGLPQVSHSHVQHGSLTHCVSCRRWHKPKDGGTHPQQVKFNNNNNSFSNKNSYEEEDTEDIDVGEENLDVSLPDRREDSLGRQRSHSSGKFC